MTSYGRDKRFISSPKCADRFWRLLILLFGGYGDFFPSVARRPGHGSTYITHIVHFPDW